MTDPGDVPAASYEQSGHRLMRPDKLGRLLAETLGDDSWRDLDVKLIAGGKSNLTFELIGSAGSRVLRRPG